MAEESLQVQLAREIEQNPNKDISQILQEVRGDRNRRDSTSDRGNQSTDDLIRMSDLKDIGKKLADDERSGYSINDVNEQNVQDDLDESQIRGDLCGVRGDGALFIDMKDDTDRVDLCKLYTYAESIDHDMMLNEWRSDGRTEWLLIPNDD